MESDGGARRWNARSPQPELSPTRGRGGGAGEIARWPQSRGVGRALRRSADARPRGDSRVTRTSARVRAARGRVKRAGRRRSAGPREAPAPLAQPVAGGRGRRIETNERRRVDDDGDRCARAATTRRGHDLATATLVAVAESAAAPPGHRRRRAPARSGGVADMHGQLRSHARIHRRSVEPDGQARRARRLGAVMDWTGRIDRARDRGRRYHGVVGAPRGAASPGVACATCAARAKVEEGLVFVAKRIAARLQHEISCFEKR